MEAQIQIFSNPSFGQVRVAGTSDQPLFCLADVCKSLNLSNYRMVKDRLNQKGVSNIDTLTNGGVQSMLFINESNLYKVIFQSRKEEAEQYQDWVTSDVLPSIRKHGAYMNNATLEKALTSPDFLIRLATQLKDEQIKRIAAEEKIQQEAPKVLFADAIVAADNAVLIGNLANVLKQNGIDMGQNRLFKWMRDNGYLCKFGEKYNQPTQRAMEMELFEVSYNTIVRADKSIQTITTKVTGKGQMYFINKFLKTQLS